MLDVKSIDLFNPFLPPEQLNFPFHLNFPDPSPFPFLSLVPTFNLANAAIMPAWTQLVLVPSVSQSYR